MKRILFCVFMMSCILLLNRPAMADHWILSQNVSVTNNGATEGTFNVLLDQNPYNNNQWNVNISWVSNGQAWTPLTFTPTSTSPGGTYSNAYVDCIQYSIPNMSSQSQSGSVSSDSNGWVIPSAYSSDLATTSGWVQGADPGGTSLVITKDQPFTGTFTTSQPLSKDDYITITLLNRYSGSFGGTLSSGINAPESPSIFLMLLGCIPLGLVLRSHKKGLKRSLPLSTA